MGEVLVSSADTLKGFLKKICKTQTDMEATVPSMMLTQLVLTAMQKP